MDKRLESVKQVLDLHVPGEPLLMPNPWDAGIAKVFASIGFRALATTSSGFAGTLGVPDGTVSSETALAHAAAIVSASDLPVSADLEHGFGHEPAQVAETVRRAAAAGLAGCSIEDYRIDPADPIYPLPLATARVAAAARVARAQDTRLVLTARAENHLRGRDDIEDTITRLQAYAEAGADCVYAPLLVDLRVIERVVASVPVPVNVLLRANGPSVEQLASVGVARISIGGGLYLASLAATAAMARDLLEGRPESMFSQVAAGRELQAMFG
jgi:2-methylisocitrate lyase-like PEP mutase family enzyme